MPTMTNFLTKHNVGGHQAALASQGSDRQALLEKYMSFHMEKAEKTTTSVKTAGSVQDMLQRAEPLTEQHMHGLVADAWEGYPHLSANSTQSPLL